MNIQMPRPLLWISLTAIILTVSGCPLIEQPENYRFTSADRSGRGLILNPGAGAPDFEDGDNEAEAPAPREVVEPDVYRKSGDTLFILNQHRGLLIVDLSTNELLGSAPTFGYPRDLYLVNDKAYVLVSRASSYSTSGNTIDYDIGSRLYVVDLADLEDPEVESQFDFDGDLVDSRMVGNAIYAVSADTQWYWIDPVPVGGDPEAGAEDRLAKQQSEAGSWVTSINIADPDDIYEADRVQFPGAGTVIQASPFALFVASPDWQSGTTAIQYVDISDPAGDLFVRDDIEVRGQVADRFKMDAYEGVLRVVSNGWNQERNTYATTIDLSDPDDLDVLAELPFERAAGETLFATRFDGDRAYVVTFLIKDPLFVVDFSDPANPAITGELEVPGWSTHIEARGGYLIALGVDDEQDRRVAVSLFDVTDPKAPSLIERESFGSGWSWSSAYNDVKAFRVEDDLIAVPFSGWQEDRNGFDRLQFLTWSPQGLDVRGYIDLQGALVRSFSHAPSHYALTQEQLVEMDAADLDEPAVIDQLQLAEHLGDYVPVEGGRGVEVYSRYDSEVVVLKARGHVTKQQSELVVELPNLISTLYDGDNIILVGTEWNDSPVDGGAPWRGSEMYRVAVVDVEEWTASDAFTVPVQPAYGWWGYPMPYVDGWAEPAVLEMDAKQFLPPWYPLYQQDSAFLIDGLLVLRCWSQDFDVVVGDEEPNMGVAVVDVEEQRMLHAIGIGRDYTAALVPAGDSLAATWSEPANEAQPLARPLVANFAQLIDVRNATAGPAANLPGELLQYDPSSDIAVLRDYQWAPDNDVRSELRTASWDGAEQVQAVDSARLPEGAAQVRPAGSYVYIDAYDGGYALQAARIAPGGRISMTVPVSVTPQWGAFVAAKGGAAYLTVGDGAIAQYDFSGPPRLESVTEVMGLPSAIRFGDDRAYGVLGWFGLVKLPLS